MLQEILEQKKIAVARDKAERPISDWSQSVKPGSHALEAALRQKDWSLIAECKLASPAKGRLCQSYTVPQLATLYEQNGASALSVHTDLHFLGKLSDLDAVRAVTTLPILRKEFIIDSYQIYEARAHGADGILLIAAALSDEQIVRFLAIADEIGLDSLVEVHSKAELSRVNRLPAKLVGINNRNLKTFRTDIQNTFDLLPHCAPGRLIVSESGIHCPGDVLKLKQAKVRGILVGEGLVTAADVADQTRKFAL